MSTVPLSVEITDLANFFSSCARSGASIDGVACQGFSEELIGMAKSAMALETKASPAPAPVIAEAPEDHDLSRALGAMADFFRGYTEPLTLSLQSMAELEKLLRHGQEQARLLENDLARWRILVAEADAKVSRASGGDVVAREVAVLEGVRSGRIVDLTGRRRAEHARLGSGYLGPLGDAT